MSSADPCSAQNCTKPGTLRCTGCDKLPARYCSAACQKRDWKAHKRNCAGAQKYNCFLIRASPPVSRITGEPLKDADYIIPFNLEDYGNWGAEIKELRRRLGWNEVDEAGKFYPHDGDDMWYYYVYYDPERNNESSPENEIARRCLGWWVHGDVAVVRSSPMDSWDYSETFSRTELLKTTEYYRTANARDVFEEREHGRIAHKMGFSPQMFAQWVPPSHFAWPRP